MSSSPSPAPRPSFDALLSAALLLAGSLIFLGAGSLHPHINAGLGPVGSDAFFRAFADKIMRVPHWEMIHTGILAGPVLWALGVAGIVRLLPGRVAALGEVGRAALLLAAVGWAVAFVLDGFVAPVFARTITAITDPAELPSAIAPFRTNQLLMARLGMVSVVLMGAAATAFGLALLAIARGAAWRAVVGASGILVGLWPMIAAARGEFAPGPFTSPYWTLTALATGAWFAALATALPARRAEAPPTTALERGHAQAPAAATSPSR